MARYRINLAISALTVFFSLAAQGVVFAKGSVLSSPHNLSVGGGGGKHGIAYDEIRVCVFCHTPHNAVAVSSPVPLWNRALPSEVQPYYMYESAAFNQKVSQRPAVPTGASRVCLSCHDGTLALNSYGGAVLTADQAGSSSPTYMPGDVTPSRNANLTTDLSDDHPISFAYTDALAVSAQLVAPGALPPEIKLDKNSELQCTACHDPHNNEFGNFLVMNNGDPTKPGYNPTVTSPLCVSCHNPTGWDNTSPHYAGAGCLNCHMTHSSPVKQYLLSAPIDQVCFNGTGCHGTGIPVSHPAAKAVLSRSLLSVSPSGTTDASGAQASQSPQSADSSSNLQSLFSQSIYKHPIGLSGAAYNVNEPLPVRQPRVECMDCHNSHVAGSKSVMSGFMKKSLVKVKGVSKDTLGSVEAAKEYEICYKCHSGGSAFKFVGLSKPNRVIAEPDQMKRFDATNPSFHPVAANRRTSNGSSLLAQYQNSMISIACSDCHNSDQSKKAGGNGPNGPHGSRYEHILLARYDMPLKGAAGRSTSCSGYRSDYALCFTCHSEDYVMMSGTSFVKGTANEHATHVVDRCIPCFACHDPHGVPAQDGATSLNNAHLINFDRLYASSQTVPNPRYTSLGPGSGSCTVSCHAGATHSYGR